MQEIKEIPLYNSEKAPKIKDWKIEEMIGYKPKTTYYTDFSIADVYGGESGIRATFDTAFKYWKKDIEIMTELYMVLNWKIWEHYETNREIAQVYIELYHILGSYMDSTDNFTKEERNYFYRTVD